ncbi:MAG: putative site-specific integrase-resolvase [Paraglaciecola psychrophila]|jgi:predicted site-specific integrase-resolvase
MQIVYARASTAEHHESIEAQIKQLTDGGVNIMYKDQVSSVAERKR